MKWLLVVKNEYFALFHSCIESLCCYQQNFPPSVTIIAGADFRADFHDLFVKSKITSLPSTYSYNCLSFAHKNNEFLTSSDVRGFDTRNNSNLRSEYLRTKLYKFLSPSQNYYYYYDSLKSLLLGRFDHKKTSSPAVFSVSFVLDKPFFVSWLSKFGPVVENC